MIDKAIGDGVSTSFERAGELKVCSFGSGGTCCRVCAMGPCRVTESRTGVCGATDTTVAARNFARMIAAGTAAHSDHAREVIFTFIAAAKGEAPGYEIKDEEKLKSLARDFDVKTEGRDKSEIAIELGEKALLEMNRQQGELTLLKRAPDKRREVWKKEGLSPRGVDREIVETMHRTSIGVDQDYVNIMAQASRTSLADGWGGSMLATELQDIMFGTPVPLRSTVNLGVLKKDEVNIIVHGHEPLISEMIAVAALDEGLIAEAKKVGAKGINLSGICCTANEILMRRAIPIAGDFLQQELAICTGAVETMMVDVQCVMQSLTQVASCYHTEVITTSPRAKITGATHIEFDHHRGLETAKEIVRRAIANFPKRGKVDIPNEEIELVAGFSHETINYMLGGKFRSSYRPLNDNIINGRIRGVVGVVGCNNARVKHNFSHTTLVKELIANDILVLVTGCGAISCAKEGLLLPEAAKMAGSGLAEVCEAVGMPPVLHMGSCVDNSRILIAASEMVKEGGLGEDISEIPAAGCAPEWMSEKAVAIGQYFVASGAIVGFGVSFPTANSEVLSDYLFDKIEETTGGKWLFEPDPVEMAKKIIQAIDERRKALGIDKEKERVLYDMEMRRDLKIV
ncbi:MAG: anaerobic carbon-monoxide dehydrogenase catalytic subunit [Actinomycetota bacterium]|nr:anaerobic carbon-monoxide dehydrogenase catalytic subunit [Actinomycetota bacterium]